MDALADRIAARAEPGTPCRACGTCARDCQVSYLRFDAWCCAACRTRGAQVTHQPAD